MEPPHSNAQLQIGGVAGDLNTLRGVLSAELLFSADIAAAIARTPSMTSTQFERVARERVLVCARPPANSDGMWVLTVARGA